MSFVFQVMANGITASADRQTIFVVDPLEQTLNVMARQGDGTLKVAQGVVDDTVKAALLAASSSASKNFTCASMALIAQFLQRAQQRRTDGSARQNFF